jgi:pyridinium-3,5-bisthiocarboxylic acid mononucleotide nickel chelatase
VRTLYFDVTCGASGDMILAALLELGAPLEQLRADLGRLPVQQLSIGVDRGCRRGLACGSMELSWAEQRTYRHLSDLVALVQAGNYPPSVVKRCTDVLNRLAEAEASAHGVEVERVHFHEIGAVDTIVDILGASLCLEYLGIERIWYSTLTVGSGAIETEHGEMPVPVPATSRMIQGLRLRGLDTGTEILTPTGCAILTTLGEQVRAIPEGTVAGIGVGAGTREINGCSNVLRAFLIERDEHSHEPRHKVCVLESDMDHVSGEIMGFTAEQCLGAGALDVSWTPVFMKKGRPGYRLTVICEEGDRDRLAGLIIGQTRTLGIRYTHVSRIAAERESGTTAFQGTQVAEKHCRYGSYRFSKLEYESLASLARTSGRPLVELLEEYLAHRSQGGGS